uniref:Uncharacterized protein n=1 Tax=Acrobeloides nanus TaxID=290746 RepID=A0A914CWH9_9BILA
MGQSGSKKDKKNYEIKNNGEKYENDVDFEEKDRSNEPSRNDKWVIACHYKKNPKFKMALFAKKMLCDILWTIMEFVTLKRNPHSGQ